MRIGSLLFCKQGPTGYLFKDTVQGFAILEDAASVDKTLVCGSQEGVGAIL